MKTSLLQAAIGIAAAIFVAYAAATVFASAYGMHEETNIVTDYEALMRTSKEMFVELAEEIQKMTIVIMDEEGIQILRTAEGGAMVLNQDGQIIALDAFLEQDWLENVELEGLGLESAEDIKQTINAVFGETESGAIVYNIAVTPLSVQFYTAYHYAGCAGILYEFTEGNTRAYETIEMIGNWKIFYDMG